MATHDEKAMDTDTGADIPQNAQKGVLAVASDAESTYVGPEKPVQVHQVDDPDQCPHGFKLFLLSGASIAAVFLIALDQVRNIPQSSN